MRATALSLLAAGLLAGAPLLANAQIGAGPVFTSNACISEPEPPINLSKNWDFELSFVGDTPPLGWIATQNPATTSSELGPLTDSNNNLIENHFAEFSDGHSMAQEPNPDTQSGSNFYVIEFCARVISGQFIITVGDDEVFKFPTNPGDVEQKARSPQFRPVPGLSNANGVSSNLVVVRFEGQTPISKGYIDNFVLRPASGGTDENTPTPTPTEPVVQPTLPNRTPPTSEPTPSAGTPTPTPTPKLIAQSVQVIANPPLLTVSPDDFANPAGPRQSSYLNIQVIGSDGKPMDITRIDPNARIRVNIDEKGATENVGFIRSFEIGGGHDQAITDREADFIDTLETERLLSFVPSRTYDGAVRIVVDIEFESITDGQKTKKTVRGVAPIVLRSDPKASMIDPTGQFNPSQNRRLGRQPGDRGFRPDQRTNLFFRERTEQ